MADQFQQPAHCFWVSQNIIRDTQDGRDLKDQRGSSHEDAGKTENFVKAAEIKELQRRYLQQRHSDKLKDALFVWQDESYCSHQHVNRRYHHRESDGSNGVEIRKTLFQLNKPDRIKDFLD
ncbi:hypothetical protein BGZ99_009850 [Dissophora globulifera]|uniref:Uncharacterized protein n=1 Tax=Dissophora globulifera TaxID=979702 RepID=A0A9P6UYW9_9FUNG|nr:hypothetical protein BGZ99_009850 [Dissophora globulifera]